MKIGFIGLGNVGGKLAASLLRNGFDLSVRDLNKSAAQAFLDQGAHWTESPKELAENCDLIITCLGSPSIVSHVMEAEDGVIAGLSAGKLWLEMSTTEVSEVKRLAKLIEAKGSKALEAPVSGGCHRAASGNIAIFVGGEREAFDRALPALTAMGRKILHVGDLGAASALKVVTNYLAFVNLVSVGEALTVCKLAGLDMATAYEGIKISSGNSFVHETESQVILNGSYNINFTMDLAIKDMKLFDDLAQDLGAPLEVSPLVLNILRDGQERYGPKAWSSMIVKRLEDACNIDLRADGFPEELTDDEPEVKGAEVTLKH